MRGTTTVQFEVHAELAVEQEESRFRITLPGQWESVAVSSTGSYYKYEFEHASVWVNTESRQAKITWR